MALSDVVGLVKQKIETFIMREITTSAGDLAETARKNASWSSKIPGAIEVSEAQTDGAGKYWIDIKVDLKKAPMAAAFEYGSGIHRKEGGSLYPIKARNAPNLVFFWEKEDKWFVGKELPHGHPGVAARPYLAPAVEANKKTIRERLLKAFVAGYRDAVPRIEFIKVE